MKPVHDACPNCGKAWIRTTRKGDKLICRVCGYIFKPKRAKAAGSGHIAGRVYHREMKWVSWKLL